MRLGKRLFDVMWSCLGLLLLSPLFLVLAVLIKFKDGGTVFFWQQRIGRSGKPFMLLKFRSMVVNAEKLGKQLTVGEDKRITPIGRWLRKTKIDELPQLVNVLRGDMSLVGPRPEVPQYVALYSLDQLKVLDLFPGVTDLASIRYRDESSILAQSLDPERTYIEEIMPSKIRMNLEYGSQSTVWTDFLVVLRTIFCSFRRPVP